MFASRLQILCGIFFYTAHKSICSYHHFFNCIDRIYFVQEEMRLKKIVIHNILIEKLKNDSNIAIKWTKYWTRSHNFIIYRC